MSGGCILNVGVACFISRAYPIVVPLPEVSGWHCRAINLSDVQPCTAADSLTAVAVCLKSF